MSESQEKKLKAAKPKTPAASSKKKANKGSDYENDSFVVADGDDDESTEEEEEKPKVLSNILLDTIWLVATTNLNYSCLKRKKLQQ